METIDAVEASERRKKRMRAVQFVFSYPPDRGDGGLDIVRNVVARYGGQVEVNSKGKVTSIVLKMPELDEMALMERL